MAAARTRNAFRRRTSKVALGLRASVFCKAVATDSGSLTNVGSEPAKSVKLMERGFHQPGDVENRLGYHVGQLGTESPKK